MRRKVSFIAHKMQMLFYRLTPMRHWYQRITPKNVQYDFWAGLTGAVMVLPQGIAFSLIAGLPPEFGLYSAIVVQIIAGFWGSSLHMVSGPTIALSIVIPNIVSNYAAMGSPEYIGLSLTLMLIVGVIQLAFGLFRLGGLVNFISHTVIIGFTAGSGVLIILSQLPTYLGIDIARGLSFIDKWGAIYQQLPHIHWHSFIVATVTLITAISLRIYRKKLPFMLLGMIAGAVTASFLGGEEAGIAMLGALPEKLPRFIAPPFDILKISAMIPSAFALALLGLIEAVSIARSLSIRSHQRIDGNQEFFGQGLSNIIGSFLSCYVGSGSFNRSAVNYDAGAKTPFALLFSSLIVATVIITIPWITRYLPMAAMAGVIMLAGYNLFDITHIKIIARTSTNETAIILVTFLSTLFLNLEFAIYVGVILSLVLYLQKTAHPVIVEVDFSSITPAVLHQDNPPKISVVQINGSLFFGAIDHIHRTMEQYAANHQWQHVIIMAEGINLIDISGIEFLISERERLLKYGGDLYIIGLKPHVREELRKSPYWRDLDGDEKIFESTYSAFRDICKKLEIQNYRDFMRLLFHDYNKLGLN